ncbi:MAG: hypothetical protein ABL912_01670 [Novosphingobium sp.]
MTFVPGRISARTVYRALRRELVSSGEGAMYLWVGWGDRAPFQHPEWVYPQTAQLPPRTLAALHALDGWCKTLDEGNDFWEGRLRCWGGRACASRNAKYRDHDRARGLRHAAAVANLLRAAAADGVDLKITTPRGCPSWPY